MSEKIPYTETIERMKSDIDYIAEEAYQKGFEAGQHEATTLEYQQGLEDGKARNENGCVGCRYDNGRIDHSPCDYCCNAYSNQWSAKPCSDEIEVGDEVTYTFIDGAEIPPFVVFVIKDNGENRRYYEGYRCTDGKWVGGGLDYKKTGRHFPQVAELFKAMKGEQRNCSTCKHQLVNSIECVDCCGYKKYEPKEGAE